MRVSTSTFHPLLNPSSTELTTLGEVVPFPGDTRQADESSARVVSPVGPSSPPPNYRHSPLVRCVPHRRLPFPLQQLQDSSTGSLFLRRIQLPASRSPPSLAAARLCQPSKPLPSAGLVKGAFLTQSSFLLALTLGFLTTVFTLRLCTLVRRFHM